VSRRSKHPEEFRQRTASCSSTVAAASAMCPQNRVELHASGDDDLGQVRLQRTPPTVRPRRADIRSSSTSSSSLRPLSRHDESRPPPTNLRHPSGSGMSAPSRRMVQVPAPTDYATATKTPCTVDDIARKTLKYVGHYLYACVDHDARDRRPTEVDTTIGDHAKARTRLR
jgi:hypothetical protein